MLQKCLYHAAHDIAVEGRVIHWTSELPSALGTPTRFTGRHCEVFQGAISMSGYAVPIQDTRGCGQSLWT